MKFINKENLFFRSLLFLKYFFNYNLNHCLTCDLRNIDINNILYSNNIKLKVKYIKFYKLFILFDLVSILDLKIINLDFIIKYILLIDWS